MRIKDEDRGHSPARPNRWWRRSWFRALLSLFVLACLLLIVAAEYILHNAEPILRKRVIETLEQRFHAPVELDHLDISLFRGIEVNGYGLRIGYKAGSPSVTSGQPMISVQHFAFRTSLRSLLHQPTHVALVRVDEMELHIPPPGDHDDLQPEPNQPKPKLAIIADQLQCRDVKLFIESARPSPDNGHKPPLEFNIATLDMEHVGRDQALHYDAQLTNPKPVGTIHAVGHFGPWANGVPGGQPGQTPIDGDYSFDHADLSSIKGIGGTLSSTGHFAGLLDRITVDGHTDTPDFSLDISNHSVPLHTDFHAIVDGENGDTFLEPVHARLAGSEFTASGKIVTIKGQGHDVELDVDIPHGRMQDFLRLAVKTNPPLMNGILTMHARLHIPPGKTRVPEKLSMAGTFHIAGVQFNNLKWQNSINGLSARAQGRPQELVTGAGTPQPEVHSQISANFTLSHGVLSPTDVHYDIPGAAVLLNGVYSMDGKLFEFKGRVRTQATASEMVGGWKGLLLQPLDRFLQKNGAGVELPVEISGTNGDLHFGLATHGLNDTPAQMLAEVKGKAQSKTDMTAARGAAAQADAEDLAAAHATTLEDATRLHALAVRHRAEAQGKVTAAQKASGDASH
ncbi:MAG: hypothetical protein ACRYFU_08000 [Janthinobacterium lividum]